MGCGATVEKSKTKSASIGSIFLPSKYSCRKRYPLSYGYWVLIFDYFTIRELACVSQVSRLFYSASGDKTLFAKFDQSIPKTIPQTKASLQPIVKIRNYDESSLSDFTSLSNGLNPEYDFVADKLLKPKPQRRIILKNSSTKNDIITSEVSDIPLARSRATPKFLGVMDSSIKHKSSLHSEHESDPAYYLPGYLLL